MCQPYIESTTVLSDIYIYTLYEDTNTDHFTLLVPRVRGNKQNIMLKAWVVFNFN